MPKTLQEIYSCIYGNVISVHPDIEDESLLLKLEPIISFIMDIDSRLSLFSLEQTSTFFFFLRLLPIFQHQVRQQQFFFLTVYVFFMPPDSD